jgi:hypothetical protein
MRKGFDEGKMWWREFVTVMGDNGASSLTASSGAQVAMSFVRSAYYLSPTTRYWNRSRLEARLRREKGTNRYLSNQSPTSYGSWVYPGYNLTRSRGEEEVDLRGHSTVE